MQGAVRSSGCRECYIMPDRLHVHEMDSNDSMCQ